MVTRVGNDAVGLTSPDCRSVAVGVNSLFECPVVTPGSDALPSLPICNGLPVTPGKDSAGDDAFITSGLCDSPVDISE